MVDAIEGISGASSQDRADKISLYMSCIDSENQDDNREFETGNSYDGNTAADISPGILDNDSSVSLSVAIESDSEMCNVIKEAFMDSDGDGIPDNIDATGKESQIEQAYDKDAKERAISEENARAFASLFAMLSNLDLTKLDNFYQHGNTKSLAVQAMAGAAQVALTNTARLQDQTNIPQAKPEDVQQLIKNQKNKTLENQQKAFATLATLANASYGILEKIKLKSPAKQAQFSKNLLQLKSMLDKSRSVI